MKDKKLTAKALWVYLSFLAFLATVEVAWAILWMMVAKTLPEHKEEIMLKLFLETIIPVSIVFGYLAIRWALSQNFVEFKRKKS